MPQRRAWQQGWWSGARAYPSPNFGPRPPGTAVTLVVLHSISLPPGVFGGDHVERLFTNRLDIDAPDAHPFYAGLRDVRVSAHFFVRRNGTVQQFVSCDERAWHAGVSSWRGRDNCNDWSIGIELEGIEGGLFEAAQYDRLGSVLPLLCGRYPLQEAVGHEHIAPGRKADPGDGFDWTRLRRALRGRGPRLPVIAHLKA